MSGAAKGDLEGVNGRGLRSWRPWRWRAAIEGLSELATPAAIELLKEVASGARKGFLSRYSLRQQLYAIEHLGRSRRREALDFLKHIYSQVITVEYYEQTYMYGSSDTMTVTDSYEAYTYPNASPALKEALGFRVQIYDGIGGKIMPDKERQEKFSQPPHVILRSAIEALSSKMEIEDAGATAHQRQLS